MPNLKSLFISAYMGALAGALLWAAWCLIDNHRSRPEPSEFTQALDAAGL